MALVKTGFAPEEQEAIFQITAGILHLGNIEFEANGQVSVAQASCGRV